MLRTLAALALLCIASPVFAQQSGTVPFDPPNNCVIAGTFAPSTDAASTCPVTGGYRLYRNGTLVGAIAPGGSITFPVSGSDTIAVEAVGARGPGPRVTATLAPSTVPGPVRNFTISGATCTGTAVALTCSFTATPAP
jgi:hypothetical protein